MGYSLNNRDEGKIIGTLKENLAAHVTRQFPKAVQITMDQLSIPPGLIAHTIVAADLATSVFHPFIAVPKLGGNALNELEWLMMIHPKIIHMAKNELLIEMLPPKGQRRKTKDFAVAPVLTLYTDRLAISSEEIVRKFDEVGMSVDILSEDEQHQTVFISYGGPDQPVVDRINQFLVSRGVKTWYFPVNKLPGQKLHRMMSEGVKTHDRVLVVCSKNSLSRNGVLNEIERVLEREAREGGSEILIPLAIDDHLFSDEFHPARLDLDQLKSRVAAVVPDPHTDAVGFEREMSLLLTALRRG